MRKREYKPVELFVITLDQEDIVRTSMAFSEGNKEFPDYEPGWW